MCKSYNGYANYQTWIVALWIDNESGSQSYWQERAEELGKENEKNHAVSLLADELKDEHEQNQPETSGVFSDLLSFSLSSVEWRDIAENLIGECEIEEEVGA